MPTDIGRIPRLHKFLPLGFSIVVLISLVLTSTVQAQLAEGKIKGMPAVIDADILKFGQQRVILWGIDAPERPQNCRMSGKPWGCHEVAKRHLQLLAGRGEVTCVLKGSPDRLGRHFGVCTSGGQDLNAEMVKAGVALAFEKQSDLYFPQMLEAISAGVGLWQVGVKFEEPWIFRLRETPGGLR